MVPTRAYRPVSLRKSISPIAPYQSCNPNPGCIHTLSDDAARQVRCAANQHESGIRHTTEEGPYAASLCAHTVRLGGLVG